MNDSTGKNYSELYKWTSLYTALKKVPTVAKQNKKQFKHCPRPQSPIIKSAQREEANMETLCGLDYRTFLLEYLLNTYSTLRQHLLFAPKYSFLKLSSLMSCPIKLPRNIFVHRWQRGPFKFSKMYFIFVCHTSHKRGNCKQILLNRTFLWMKWAHPFGSSDQGENRKWCPLKYLRNDYK